MRGNTTFPLLKAGIIGYGKVGRVRYKCIEADPRVELAGICDLMPQELERNNIPYFRDYRDLLALRPDIIFICTFNRFIPQIAVEAINYGIHIFTEKPPGCSLSDVALIRAAAEANPAIKVKFGFNHRYHEAVMDAKSIIDSGRMGEIMWLRGVYGKAGGLDYDKNWRNNRKLSGGGILIDQGIHMLDLFRYFTGGFNEVKSFIGRSYWTHLQVEDNAFALLRHTASGRVAMLHSSATQWRHKFLLEIYMTRGYIEIDGILSSTRTYGRESLKIARCVNEKGYPLPNPQENMSYYEEDKSWFRETRDFVDCVLHGLPVICGGVDDAYETMALVEQIYDNDAQALMPIIQEGRI